MSNDRKKSPAKSPARQSGRSHAQSNPERSRRTRQALIHAARHLFVQNGYADTPTPEIVRQSGLTRGALYHHFADKSDLLRAVLTGEANAVAEHIEQHTRQADSPTDALLNGTTAYFEAMRAPGRAKLLLIEGPAVLGLEEMTRLNNLSGAESLRDGLELALNSKPDPNLPLDELADVLSAAFDRAALAIAQGGSEMAYQNALRLLLSALLVVAPKSKRHRAG